MKLLTGLMPLVMLFGIGCSYDDSKKGRINHSPQAIAGEENSDQDQDMNSTDEPKVDEPTQNEPSQNEPIQDEPALDDPNTPDQGQNEPDQDDAINQGDITNQTDTDTPAQGDEPSQDDADQNDADQDDMDQDTPDQSDINVQAFVEERGREEFITHVEERLNKLESEMTQLAEDSELRTTFDQAMSDLQALRDAADEELVEKGEKILESIRTLERGM